MSNKASSLIASQTLGLSSVASLIASFNFVPYKTRLISNQQTVFPGCSEIIAHILKRPNGEWTFALSGWSWLRAGFQDYETS